MKKLLRVAVFLLACNELTLVNAKKEENTALIPVPNTESNHYDYQDRHNHIKNQAELENHEIVFIGDSITHFFGGAVAQNVDDYEEYEMNTGGDVWEEYYDDRSTLNAGFGFDRTQNVLWRLDHGELKGQTPKVCVLLIGTNNLQVTDSFPVANTADEIVEGIMAVTAKIHSITPSTKILLLGILPRKEPEKFEVVQQVNAQLAFADPPDYIAFLDMMLHFTDSSGDLDRNLFRRDGVHPNGRGYTVWAETMESVLQQLLEEASEEETDPEARRKRRIQAV